MNAIEIRWVELKSKMKIGDEIVGHVIAIKPFGLLVNIGFEVIDGYKLSGIVDLSATVKPGIRRLSIERESWPKLNEKIICKVMGYRERNFEVDLGIKA